MFSRQISLLRQNCIFNGAKYEIHHLVFARVVNYRWVKRQNWEQGCRQVIKWIKVCCLAHSGWCRDYRRDLRTGPIWCWIFPERNGGT